MNFGCELLPGSRAMYRGHPGRCFDNLWACERITRWIPGARFGRKGHVPLHPVAVRVGFVQCERSPGIGNKTVSHSLMKKIFKPEQRLKGSFYLDARPARDTRPPHRSRARGASGGGGIARAGPG